MSKCGGHWEWSLPGSLSFSVVLLRPTPSQRDGSAILRGHASHERYTISNLEGRETNLHMPIRAHRGLNPGPPRDRRTHYHLRYCNPPMCAVSELLLSPNRQLLVKTGPRLWNCLKNWSPTQMMSANTYRACYRGWTVVSSPLQRYVTLHGIFCLSHCEICYHSGSAVLQLEGI